MAHRTVGELLEKPSGDLRLDAGGRWWASRDSTGLDDEGRVTVVFADGRHTARINGTPAALRRAAETVLAQLDGAIANTPAERFTFAGQHHCPWSYRHCPHDWVDRTVPVRYHCDGHTLAEATDAANSLYEQWQQATKGQEQ